MKNFRELHGKKRRGKVSAKRKMELSEKRLLANARKVFQKIRRRKKTKELASLLPDTAIRIDLVGSPEVSFMLLIKNGKIGFSTKRTAARLAIGIHKELFLKLIKNPPKTGNLKIALFDNIFLRKGPIREFRWLKAILVHFLLG
ncbi:MAG: hypothetical protein V1672_01770 [Candidatus Diapherotrites archaeon]